MDFWLATEELLEESLLPALYERYDKTLNEQVEVGLDAKKWEGLSLAERAWAARRPGGGQLSASARVDDGGHGFRATEAPRDFPFDSRRPNSPPPRHRKGASRRAGGDSASKPRARS